MNLPVAFFGASPGSVEILLVFVVVLLLFGPKSLPKMARMIGKILEELRSVSQDFHNQIMGIEDDILTEEPVGQERPIPAEEYSDYEEYPDYEDENDGGAVEEESEQAEESPKSTEAENEQVSDVEGEAAPQTQAGSDADMDNKDRKNDVAG